MDARGRAAEGTAGQARELPRGVALAAAAVAVALALARLVLAVADPRSSDAAAGPKVPGGGVPLAAFEATVLIALAFVGVVVAMRRAANPVGWILCAIPVALGVLLFGAHLYWSLAFADGPRSGAATFVAWLCSWVWIGVMVPMLALFPLLFPTGAPPTPAWRRIGWLACAAAPALFAGEALGAGRLQDYPVDNPLGAEGALATTVDVLGGLGFVLMLIATLGAAASLIVRFRRSRGDERQQLKWVMAAAVIFITLFIAPTQKLLGEDTGFSLLLLGLLIVAVAVAVAMLRYRLYDLDVVVNRALVYAALTITLAASYLLAVLLLDFLLDPLTPDSQLAVAVSTLAVAALFRPARARIQRAVDRRFFRRRYDARLTLERFGQRLRDELGLDALDGELRGVVTDTMAPAHVSLWLREGGQER